MNKQSKRKRGPVILLILGILLTVCGCVFAFFYYQGHVAYETSKKMVETVRDEFLEPAADVPYDGTSDVDVNLQRRIDFNGLLSINGAATSWLYIPDTNVDYYVMQEPVVGETSYLWKDIYQSYSSWGSLLSPAQPGDADDAHQLIFGHNMGSYYGAVGFTNLGWYKDVNYAANHEYVYTYYPEYSMRWRVWTACISDASDMVYEIPYTLESDSYEFLLTSINDQGLYHLNDAPAVTDRILVLSTCDGMTSESEERFYVVCIPDGYYYYE